MKFNEEMNVKIISKEEANREILFVLQHTYGFRTTEDLNGIVRMTEDQVAYVQPRISIAIEESSKMNKGLFKVNFCCGIRECGTYDSEKMLENAKFLEKIANATRRLNDLFKDVLVEE